MLSYCERIRTHAVPQYDGHLGGLGSLALVQQAEKYDNESKRDHPGGAGDAGLARGRDRRRHTTFG